MSRSTEDGVITAIYVARATAVGIDREEALLNIISALSVVTTPTQFAEAIQMAYTEIEKNNAN